MSPSFTKGSAEALRSAGALSTVGLAFVLALVLGFWFGSLLDGWFGTKPLFTIVFFFLGLAAGILNVFRIVSQAFPRGRSAPAAPPLPVEPAPSDLDMHGDDD
jgi:F0F1-type ATP synthase assembly protein I